MLREWDNRAMSLIAAHADEGKRAPTCDELVEATGASCVATTVNIVKRLERMGLIQVDRYQRERQITVTATGKSTAPVKTKAIHWRQRPRPAAMPSISVTYAEQRAIRKRQELSVSEQFAQAARQEGLSVPDFIAELVWAGWQAREEARG